MAAVTPESIREKLEQPGKKLILMHENADPDALGSSAALAASFPEIDLGAYVGLNKSAKQMAEKLGIEVLGSPSTGDYETVIVVDCSTPSQLAAPLDHPDVVVIDHHTNTGAWKDAGCALVLIDESKVSCAEIVLEILDVAEEGREVISREIGLYLLCGMLTDSGHFRFATAATLAAAAYIMEKSGVELPDIHEIIETDAYFDVSRKVAMLKAAQRSAIEQVGKYIIATSVVGAFEAQCCRGLMIMGADIVLIGSQNRKKFRISGRAKPYMLELGVNLGILMNDIASEIGAEGGGHDAAAGMKGEGDVDAMLHICRQRLKSDLLARK